VLGGCGTSDAGAAPKSSAPTPVPAISSLLVVGRAAVAEDYRWFGEESDFGEGFCFTWVRGLTPQQVIKASGGKELERIGWQQLVGSGDGQEAGADRYFYGAAHVAEWTVLVEDGGDFGATGSRVLPLSRGRRLISHYRAADGTGRLLVLEDERVRLDFDPGVPGQLSGADVEAFAPVVEDAGFGKLSTLRFRGRDEYLDYCAEAGFALVERVTGVAMTQELLSALTWLWTSVPKGVG
jgi:hypothetical protein